VSIRAGVVLERKPGSPTAGVQRQKKANFPKG
jgi:hypothetical protein